MKILILFLGICVCLTLVTATPQVIFTGINLTISGNCTSVVYTINGEGIIAKDVVGTNYHGEIINGTETNCTSASFSYQKDNIPITFSRDIGSNETDVAILIHSLATNNNITQQWIQCTQNLTTCLADYGFRSNYSDCRTSLLLTQSDKGNLNNVISDKQKEVDNLKTHRLILAIIAGASVGYVIYTTQQSKVRTIKSPLGNLPGTVGIR